MLALTPTSNSCSSDIKFGWMDMVFMFIINIIIVVIIIIIIARYNLSLDVIDIRRKPGILWIISLWKHIYRGFCFRHGYFTMIIFHMYLV
uniref:Putative ovule protein n=1 Tax=Solanum chacoense TaxID=4108 RepID=A0A0V0GR27_SOLCH